MRNRATHGVPRLIVSDQGGDVRGASSDTVAVIGTRLPLAHGPQGSEPPASVAEPMRWARFVAQLSQTKAKLQQTSLACCVGRGFVPRPGSEFGSPLRWRGGACGFSTNRGQRMNRSQTVSGCVGHDRSQATGGEAGLATGLSTGHRRMEPVALGDPSGGKAGTPSRHRQRFGRGIAAAVYGNETVAIGTRDRRGDDGIHRGAGVGCPVGGELLIVSTEILESLFGAYKNLEGQQSESGVTG